MKRLSQLKKKNGSVLIIVLWLIMLGMILVTAIASNIRLSATTVIHHKDSLEHWSRILETVNKAHLELLINKMPKLKVQETSSYKGDNSENHFDGRLLQLSYKTPKDMSVRIYDLSGKLNISNIRQNKLKAILEHLLGEHDKKIPELMDAWFDWIDKDELKRLNGAEKQYYKKQNLSYEPRNGPFASVDEIRLIKGFDEVFKDIKLDNVFTVTGKSQGTVNPNVASKNVLMILPGMNEKLAMDLIKARKEKPFKNINDVNVHLTPVVISKVSRWFSFRSSNYFSIVVYPSELEGSSKEEQAIYVYKEEVMVANSTSKPVILRVDPFYQIKLNLSK